MPDHPNPGRPTNKPLLRRTPTFWPILKVVRASETMAGPGSRVFVGRAGNLANQNICSEKPGPQTLADQSLVHKPYMVPLTSEKISPTGKVARPSELLPTGGFVRNSVTLADRESCLTLWSTSGVVRNSGQNVY